MPRVNTRIARFDTYTLGAKIPASNKKGYRIDRSKPRDESDTIFCKKGETFYTWKFYKGAEHRSKIRPKASQLTQSEFLSRAYELQERIEDFELWDSKEDVESFRDELVSESNELRDETEEKLYNMPDQLQYSPTGELLQERIDACDNFISELENIDLEAEDIQEEFQNIYLAL